MKMGEFQGRLAQLINVAVNSGETSPFQVIAALELAKLKSFAQLQELEAKQNTVIISVGADGNLKP